MFADLSIDRTLNMLGTLTRDMWVMGPCVSHASAITSQIHDFCHKSAYVLTNMCICAYVHMFSNNRESSQGSCTFYLIQYSVVAPVIATISLPTKWTDLPQKSHIWQ